MILTITDHYHETLSVLAGGDGVSAELCERITAELSRQPSSVVVVSPQVLTRLLAEVTEAPHIPLTERSA